MKRKIAFVTTVIVLVLSLTVSVGCTLAWLFTSTESVVNTFTPSDIDITLTEGPQRTFQMIPGKTYTKDPIVAVTGKTDIDIWLFVKFDASANAETFLEYDFTLDDAGSGWTQGDGTDIPENVWYIKVTTHATTKSWNLLAGDTVKIKESVTKQQLNALTADTYPTLTFDAAAVQFDNLTAKAAYEQAVWTDATT